MGEVVHLPRSRSSPVPDRPGGRARIAAAVEERLAALRVGERAGAEPDGEGEEDDHPLTHHQRGRKPLVGQWIDITGVPEGDYVVRVTINVGKIFDEGKNRYPNVIYAQIHVPDPRKKVTVAP